MSASVNPYLLLNAAAQLFEKLPADLSDEEAGQAADLALKEGLMQRKILESAEAAGVPVDEAELQKARQEIEERFSSRDEYLEELERSGMNEETLSNALRDSLRVEKVMQKVASMVTVSDEEITSFYGENREKFEHPELREASHILITINPQFPENRRKAAKARLKKIAGLLAEKPESFPELAMQYSECPTALEGGFLGKLPRGKLFPELNRMLFAMSEGEISHIIESPVGLHLLRCNRIHEAGIAPLEEAAETIRAHLLEPRVRTAQRQWIKALFGN